MRTRLTHRVGNPPWIRRTGQPPPGRRSRTDNWIDYLAQAALVVLVLAALLSLAAWK